VGGNPTARKVLLRNQKSGILRDDKQRTHKLLGRASRHQRRFALLQAVTFLSRVRWQAQKYASLSSQRTIDHQLVKSLPVVSFKLNAQ
jgi:hypothetical protein